jgi:acetyl esterase
MPLQPAYIALHGGGHNAGSLASHDTMCRELAIASGAIVCALEYRLAPRDVAPAPVLDAVCAFTWVAKHAVKLGVDARRLGIVGDSAGGNLAAAACVKLTAGGAAAAAGVPSPRSLVLLYPFLDLTLAPSPTYERYGEGFYLRLPAIRHYVNMYLGRVTEDDGTDAAHEAESRPYVVDPRDPLVSPLHASEEQLAALPPTAIFTAECDPIRSDGEAFAARLAAAGVKHTYTCHAGMIHAYLLLGGTVRAVADLFTEIGEAMAAAVAAEPDA